jgi:formylglycine-generating enzyme required for sulfatase activity
MSQPAAGQFSGIFISYRRDDSSGHAGRLFDRLSAHFGVEQVFMDIDQIEPGEDFVQVIESAVGSCEVLIALIGRNWLTSRDESGRRLDNPNDFVRLEIAAALVRGIPVIPVLVQGARMPRPQDLPEDLLPLSRRHALELSDLRWKHDADQLTGALEKILTRQREARRIAAQQEEKRKRLEAEAQRKREEEQHRRQVAQAAEEAQQRKVAEEKQRKIAQEEARPDAEDDEEIEASPQALKPAPAIAEIASSTARPDALPLSVKTTTQRTMLLIGEAEQAKKISSRIRLIAGAMLLVLLAGGALLLWLAFDPVNIDTSPTVNQTQGGQQISQAANKLQNMTNPLGMEFVWIPPGSFMMGSENGDSDEKPVHQVTFREGFYMGKYEVTQAQWQQVMGTNPSNFKGDSLPIETVSWNDAQKFIRKLNEMNDGFVYRLPSEAEWEYACRAGTTGDYAGNLGSMAWYVDNSGNQTHPVGQKQANAFGLYDMHGNVSEWCADAWHENYNGAPTDGSIWLSGGDSSRRVLRGGSWGGNGSYFSPTERSGLSERLYVLGFRVVAAARR